jgi:hypothetical protein
MYVVFHIPRSRVFKRDREKEGLRCFGQVDRSKGRAWWKQNILVIFGKIAIILDDVGIKIHHIDYLIQLTI